MSEKHDGSLDTLFLTSAVERRAKDTPGIISENANRGGAVEGKTPETAVNTFHALSDIRGSTPRRDQRVTWWPTWPAWASTDFRKEWDQKEAQAREVVCPLVACDAKYAACCVDQHGRHRVAHMARHSRAEQGPIEVDPDAEVAVDLTPEGRRYLSSIRVKVAADERLRRIGAGLPPLVVDGEEVS